MSMKGRLLRAVFLFVARVQKSRVKKGAGGEKEDLSKIKDINFIYISLLSLLYKLQVYYSHFRLN